MQLSVDLSKVEGAYGSFKAWARRLEIPYTTVMGWKEAGNVPHWRAPKVLEIAQADGKDLIASPRRRKAA
jgi:hypothetical protein